MGPIDQWTQWREVKESYGRKPGYIRVVEITPASLDLTSLPEGYGTARKTKAMRINCSTLVLATSLVAMGMSTQAIGDDVQRPRPTEWDKLVFGGQFKDLFLPMPILQPLTRDTWGGENVLPRDITNGIEDAQWSYWCGYPIKGEDGTYHLFTARWPEDDPRGHFGYLDSFIVHAVSEQPLGPYKVKGTVGPGHNPELYRTKTGEYMVYSTHGRFYRSKSLDGPWKAGTYNFDKRQRYAFKNYGNFSFAPRVAGSFLAVSRRGCVWASMDGGEDWSEVSAKSVYPKVDGIFEDPVMWKDNVQYQIIVNDWKGRIAYYLRSLDGFHWKTEPGEACSPGIARYEDGTAPAWYKYERIRMLQDEYGRPTQAHFAVIDSDKHSDLPNDRHNSQHICIPLAVARLIEVLNVEPFSATTEEIRLKIKAEEGFDPHADIDLESLRFGASEEVNYGRGSKALRTENAAADLIVIFGGEGNGMTADNFAGKLLGKTRAGKLLFGWARLPGTHSRVPMLSALSPTFEFTDAGLEAHVEVQNFGEAVSDRSPCPEGNDMTRKMFSKYLRPSGRSRLRRQGADQNRQQPLCKDTDGRTRESQANRRLLE